jgi:hypothetical protein
MSKRTSFVVVLLMALVASAAARGQGGNTSLSLRATSALFFQQGARVVLTGRMSTNALDCRGRRVVRLFSRSGGTSHLMANAVTGRDGTFTFVLRPTRTVTVYVAYLGVFRSSYGRQLRCDRSHSPLLTLRPSNS